MYILGLDFETTGLADSDAVTEIGAVLWDWEAKMPVMMLDELVKVPKGVVINPVVSEMNGITVKLLEEFGVAPQESFKRLNSMGERADYLMAHNAEFDRKFYESHTKKLGMDAILCEKPWLDSAADIVYPKHMKSHKLVYLAAEHGFLNPFAHRAVFDVLTMFRVAMEYDIDEIIKYAAEKKYELYADVSYEDRLKARERGFRWNPESRKWIKSARESGLGSFRDCGFRVMFREKGSTAEWRELKGEKGS